MSAKPSPRLSISRDEIRAVYAQGEDAVIALVESLVARINALEERVEALENQLSKTSRNSSKPPSGDGFQKKTKSLRAKSNRPSGGQPGHPGNTLEWSAEVDEIEVHPVTACQGCGASLQQTPVTDWEVRQVHDLPPMRIEVREHHCEIKCCPDCGILNRGQFPQEVSQSVQYGVHLQSLIVYLMEVQLLPSQRVCELLSEVFDVAVSEGTLYNVRARCFAALGSAEQEIRQTLLGADVVHFDETGFRVKNQLWWLHVACTESLTFYFVHEKRGQKAMDEMGILSQFTGKAVHDGLKSYFCYVLSHCLCNAHHLRELIFIAERYEQKWAEEMNTLLVEMKRQVDEAKAQGQTALAFSQIASLEQQYLEIVQRGFETNPPEVVPEGEAKQRGRPKQSAAKNLLDRLSAHSEAVLRFIHDFAVPFDNNQAERDIRMMKLKQKISGGFRAQSGAVMFCRIRSYLSSLRKQGVNIWDALVQIFMGCPISPIPVAE
jgi:transposase